MLDSLLAHFGRIDQRPVEEIDRDIDDELSAHLSELEHDLILSGLAPAAARAEALSRFGNPQTYKRHCRDVALRERRMKTYLQVIIPTACGLLLGAVTTSVWFNQQSANATLATMSTRMDELNQTLASRTQAPQQLTSPSYRNVYIAGTPVGRPGQYSMPADGLSLRRLMAASGVNVKFVKEVAVRHSPKFGPGETERLSGTVLADVTGPDIELQNDDLVTITEGKP
jgi:hypothetical protein